MTVSLFYFDVVSHSYTMDMHESLLKRRIQSLKVKVAEEEKSGNQERDKFINKMLCAFNLQIIYMSAISLRDECSRPALHQLVQSVQSFS